MVDYVTMALLVSIVLVQLDTLVNIFFYFKSIVSTLRLLNSGDVCEEDYNECESNPCLNNGTCFDVTNGYSCSCQAGYSGIHCEIDVAVCNATNETRCANGGICVEGPGVTFSCKCPPGKNV